MIAMQTVQWAINCASSRRAVIGGVGKMKALQSIVLAGLFLAVPSHSLLVAKEPVAPVANDLSAADSPAANAAPDLQAVGCPGTEGCCIAHGSPGCDNFSCCDIVCGAEPFCCFAAWDSDCASYAQTLCGSTCGGSCPGVGTCCEPHGGGGCDNALCCDLVCNHTPSCCEAVWSSTCADLAVAICDVCEPPILCPQPGDCCMGRFFTPGCERSACCEKVCVELGDEICCTGEWDDVCARKARESCLNVCDCDSFGNFDADPAIDLRDAAAYQICFSGDGSSPVPSACACADYDGDGDADLQDFALFVELLAAP
jgi:hypothetical protein